MCEVDLARARLVATRVVGELDVADARVQALQRARQVALHDLHVIEVVLQAEVGVARAVDRLQRLVAARDEVARPVARVHRLEQHAHADPGHRLGREAQVAGQHVEADLAPERRGRPAGEDVEAARGEPLGVVMRLHERLPEFGLAARHRGQPGPAGEQVADRGVDERQLDAGVADRPRPCIGVVLVRELDLDGAKARVARRLRAPQCGAFEEQRREVGGEARHGVVSRASSRSA